MMGEYHVYSQQIVGTTICFELGSKETLGAKINLSELQPDVHYLVWSQNGLLPERFAIVNGVSHVKAMGNIAFLAAKNVLEIGSLQNMKEFLGDTILEDFLARYEDVIEQSA